MKIGEITKKIFIDAKNNDFAGQDPFDGLNSRIFDYLPSLRKGILGLFWIQFHKRMPINFRRLCLIPKGRNPKGIGLFILGMIEEYKITGNREYLEEAKQLGDWLLSQQSDNKIWQYSCWGYHFDWNARAFFVPKGKPNVITTIYVAQALLELSEVTGDLRYKKPALDAANFIVNSLYTKHEGRKFFAYIPGENVFVHNASLWGAAWVAKVASLTDNIHYKNLALQVARQSVKEQKDDGSWVYGTRHHHQFIDGFHTGYNLEALDVISRSLKTNEFDEAIEKGLRYYKSNLFEANGTAKYYSDNLYPLDMHSVSQAILTLLKVGKTKDDLLLTEKIIETSIKQMYLPKENRFIYQSGRYFSNKVNYMRWTQAWVYYSFSFYEKNKAS
ncbi:aspartate-semialdehyde dehydrogenase [Grimontia sp. AD028]|uniref:aspartate-semialdehyde dehydrogenase n=1 Tax=Grimontia sp. AD028 TaxID=1581149 RepID=UPI00061AC180|nr:aspartate-semialdehyde dehydrogenase [Grimontia sp. AD028]KKD59392.1 aspartate-semialdehyde dehydrogenase [Grimontia sp. AD028]